MIVSEWCIFMAGTVQFLEAELMWAVLETIVLLLRRAIAAFLTLIFMPVLMLEEFIDGLHVWVNGESVSLNVKVELVNSSVEGQAVDYSLLYQMLSKVNGAISHRVSIFLDEVDEIPEHIALRPLYFNRVHVGSSNSGTVVGMMLW